MQKTNQGDGRIPVDEDRWKTIISARGPRVRSKLLVFLFGQPRSQLLAAAPLSNPPQQRERTKSLRTKYYYPLRRYFFLASRPSASCLGRTMAGTCIVNHDWMSDKNNELLLQTSLDGTLYRLKRSKIVPDIIISVSGASLAFLFITNDFKESVLSASFTERITRMRASFKHGYIIAVTGMASELQIMAALQKVYMNMPSAPFLPVIDADTGMEKLLRLAHVLAESRRLNSTRLIQIEREEFVQSTEVLVAALTKIPSINNKDAESLLGLGSLSTIASASVDALMNGTTLTLAKANRVVNFFRDENCNRAPFLKR